VAQRDHRGGRTHALRRLLGGGARCDAIEQARALVAEVTKKLAKGGA
jgi:hypothetical protein